MNNAAAAAAPFTTLAQLFLATPRLRLLTCSDGGSTRVRGLLLRRLRAMGASDMCMVENEAVAWGDTGRFVATFKLRGEFLHYVGHNMNASLEIAIVALSADEEELWRFLDTVAAAEAEVSS